MSSGTRARCQAITHAGRQCLRAAQAGSAYCHLHERSSPKSGWTDVTDRANGDQAVATNSSRQTSQFTEDGSDNQNRNMELIRLYVAELQQAVNRLRAQKPAWTGTLPGLGRIERMRRRAETWLPDPESGTLFGELRRGIQEEGLDQQALEGAWYMLQYSLQYQVDMLRRRWRGEYETDVWGLDWEFIELVRPFLSFLYTVYWRVEVAGLEHVPDFGPGLLVGNRAGPLLFGQSMVMMAIMTDHPSQRLVRSLYGEDVARLPFVLPILEKLGQAADLEENGVRLLRQHELVAVYPEQQAGTSGQWRQAQQVARLGGSAFVPMALRTGAPLIPVAMIAPPTAQLWPQKTGSLRLPGLRALSFFTRLRTVGMLGAIPMPATWTIRFGEPIPTDDFGANAADDALLVAQLGEMVCNRVQQLRYRHFLEESSADAAPDTV